MMRKQINENPGQHNTSDSKINAKIKSKSRIIHSSVGAANFIRHNHQTDLNLYPPNWFKNKEESNGIQYTACDLHGFSSFQMANMFPECFSNVDIVSDAENIKNLFKLPYDKKSVSIMVHRIDKTLLLDKFDVEEHLMYVPTDKWDWLRKFFKQNIVRSSDTGVKHITLKKNDIQQQVLESKFLHHSIAFNSDNDQIKNNIFLRETSPLASSPPNMTPEKVFPYIPQKKQLFNQNVSWDFENMQMLIGTDLPIFRSGNNSSTSLRLRDMSKPLSMLTGIDYWLDNLLCDIPEIEFCYHLNGIVQKYELVKTKDLPCLNGTTFSPDYISMKMQNTLSFLKSNTNNVGHTYWFFKGKNDNFMYLYDLTTLCSESLIYSPNPFTVPVARLLYHVACKLKFSREDGKPYNPVTIIHLLNSCLKLLDKTKFPQVVTSVNYMLSDIYIAVYNNPLTTVIADLTYFYENSPTGHIDTAIASTNFGYERYSVNIQNESVLHKKENISKIPEYSTTDQIKTQEKCFYNALYYIGRSLSCLQYFKNDKYIMIKLEQASSSDTRPIRYIASETIGKNKNNNKSIKKKNRKQNNVNKVLKNVYGIDPDFLFYNIIAESILNAEDGSWYNYYLEQILFEKASSACIDFGKKCLESYMTYGSALKCFRQSLEFQLCVDNTDVYNLLGHTLEYCGNCFLSIFNFWDKIEQYTSEFDTDEFCNVELRETLLSYSKDCTNKDLNLIPKKLIKSKENMLSSAESCYLRALALETKIEKKTILNRRLGIVYSEYTTFYTNEILMAIETNIPLTLIKLKWLIKKSEQYFTLGSVIFKENDEKYNFIMMHINIASMYKYIAVYSSKFKIHTKNIKEENLYFKVENIFMELLSELENRSSNPKLWDMVYLELSSVLYYLSVQNYLALCRDNSKNYRECINLFKKALKYCDLENDTPNRFKYEYQAAYIHLGLASLYSVRLEKCITMKSPEVNSVLLQIKSYYTISFETYFKIKCPLESLEVLVKMLIFEMRFIDDMIGVWNVKHIKSILKTLGKCEAVLLMFLENKDTMTYLPSTDQIEELDIEGKSNFEMRKLNFLKILKENVCNLLKCMIKLAITKTSEWLADKEDELKTIYELLLRNKVGDNNYLHLMIGIKQLSKFSDN